MKPEADEILGERLISNWWYINQRLIKKLIKNWCWQIDHRTISYWWEIDQNWSAIDQSLIKNQSLVKKWSATDRNAQVVRKLDPRQFIRLASEAAPKINVNTNVSFKMMIIIMRRRFIITCQDQLSLGWWSKSWFAKNTVCITGFSRECKYMLFQHKTICSSKETKLLLASNVLCLAMPWWGVCWCVCYREGESARGR